MALSSQARLVLTLPLLAGMMRGTQGDSSLQQQGPLITKTESHVLLIECRFPFYLAWMNKWSRSPVDLELTYHPHAQPLHRQSIAKLLDGEKKPWKFERFEDDPLVEARAVKIPEAELQKGDNCVSCRTLIVTMPGSYGPHGEYSCSAVYFATDNDRTRTSTTYTVSVNEKRSDKVINGTLTVEKVLAHKLEVRWQDSESLRGLGRVSVSRTTVDSKGCPLGHMYTAVELFALNRNIDGSPPKLDEVLLNNLVTQETSTLTLFVRKDPFCFPDCTYSCEVSGRRCPESTDCETCAPWDIAFGVSAVLLFLVILVIVLYAFRHSICTCIREKCKCTCIPERWTRPYTKVNQDPPHCPVAANNPPQGDANDRPQDNPNNPNIQRGAENNPPQDNPNNPNIQRGAENNPPQDNPNNPNIQRGAENNPPQDNPNNPNIQRGAENNPPQNNPNNSNIQRGAANSPPQDNPNNPNIHRGAENNPPQDNPNNPNTHRGAANNPPQDNPNNPNIQRGAANNPPQDNPNNPNIQGGAANNPPQDNPNNPNIQGGAANNPPQDNPNNPNNQRGTASNPPQDNPNDPNIQRGAENHPPALGPRAFTSAVAPDPPPQRASGDRLARGPNLLPQRYPSPYAAARGTPLDSAVLASLNLPIPAEDRDSPRRSLDAGVLEESDPLNELELPVSSGYPARPETVHMRGNTEV